MINKIWNWIKQAITPHRQKDEHLEFYEDVPEPTIKVNHCDTHTRFIKSCSACLMSVMGEK